MYRKFSIAIVDVKRPLGYCSGDKKLINCSYYTYLLEEGMGAPASFNNLRLTGESERSLEADRFDEVDRLSRAADFSLWIGPRLTIMASPSDEESSDWSASFFFFFSFFCFFFFLRENQVIFTVIVKLFSHHSEEKKFLQTIVFLLPSFGDLHSMVRKWRAVVSATNLWM